LDAQSLEKGPPRGNFIKEIWGRMNKWMLLVAIVHFVLTFYTDGRIFTSQSFDFDFVLPLDSRSAPYYYVLAKVLALVCLIIFYQILYLFWRAARTKNKKFLMDFMLPFGIILGVYLVNFAICFPGLYKIDDTTMYAMATRGYAFYWHSYLTSLYYMVGLTLFPFSSGQMVMTDLFAALIFAYFFYRLSSVLPDKKWNKLKWLLLIVALSPFMNTIGLETFRTYIYALLNMFFFGYLLFEKIQKRRFTLLKFLLLALCVGVLAFWRSESIVYLVFAPFLIFVTYRHDINIKKALAFAAAGVAFFGVVNIPQSVGNTRYYNNDYLIVSTTRPLSIILNLDGTTDYEGAEEDLAAINNIIGVDHIKLFPGDSISYQSWNTITHEGRLSQTMSTKEAQSDYIKAFFDIVMHNKKAFLKERLDLFIDTNNLDGILQVNFGKELVRTEDPSLPALAPYWELNTNLNESGITPRGMSETGLAWLPVITLSEWTWLYSVIPCLLLAIFLIILSIRYKAWLVFMTELILLVREGIIFLTSPSAMISYYMPTSLISLFMGILLIAFYVYNKKAEKKEKLFV